MATTVTKVVDPDSGSGYDYASASLWEAGQQGDLTGVRDEIAVAKCRCTGGTADTTAVTIDGWTTSTTQYIKIWTDPAEGYRHNGTYQTGNKYRLSLSGNHFVSYESFIKIYGIQFAATVASDMIFIRGNSEEICIDKCLVKNIEQNTVGSCLVFEYEYVHKNHIISNSIFYDCDGDGVGGIWFRDSAATSTGNVIYNCTFFNMQYYGIRIGRADTVTAKNNIFRLVGSCFFNTTSLASGSGYNATDNATLNYAVTGGATGDRVSQTFTFVDEANDDFHLASNDTGALGYGLNLYNDAIFPFQTDIDGDDRGGSGASWDIGADEYVAAGGSSIVPLLLHQYRARRQ